MILAGLAHPSTTVQAALLHGLSGIEASISSVVLSAVVALASSDSASVWASASRLLRTACCRDPAVMEVVFGSGGALAGDQSVQRVRALELFAMLAAESDDAFERCASAGHLDAIAAASRDSDVLIRLNGLEIVGKMCQSQRCYRWVVEQGLVAEMIQVNCLIDIQSLHETPY
eukprot:TRINITY_DN32995_c0_g1_i4.p1 TRINITY_DN32995_c0_g1~~TRINITY_DN32995_c0_g1_i4.p1  ORF type:complete len:173 (-),score=35.52 TRINITY_DN32995_c0_g1_i4:163-681(-)